MNNGTTFYSTYGNGQWSQGANGFQAPPSFQQRSFGSPGFDNGFQSSGLGATGFANKGFCQEAASNGYTNNNLNGYSQPRQANGFNDNGFKTMNGGDWTKQAVGCENQEKDLFDSINSGINFDKYDDIPVHVSGGNPPNAIETFAAANLHEFVYENVQKSGYTKPTPVQKHSIPTLLANRDLMSCAQTGSGKTAAFLLPIIHHILANGPNGVMAPTMNSQGRRTFYPSALILSPTRELAIQIHKEASKFSYRTNLVSAILYGGRENYREQINRLRAGCNILIATPGRLIDIIEQGYIGLAGCKYLVLDEADRMLDMGFEPQIRKIVQSGQMPDKNSRITAMFSATFPKAIQELAQDFLKPDYLFLAVGRVGSTSENIEQHVIFVEEHEKKKMLMDILVREEETNLVLVFVETKRGANELTYFLQKQSFRAVAIHGDLKQYERERNLQVFRNGQFPILVATAVAARGLDIPNVKHVINNDLPSDIDEYVHRIGRTGRCGNTGRATSFFNDKNRGIAKDLLNLMAEANKDIPDWLRNAASEGRISTSNRGSRGRFGGMDYRRGGASRGGGYSNVQSSNFGGPPSNGYGGYSGGFGGGYSNGFSSRGGGAVPSFSGRAQAGFGGFDNAVGYGSGGNGFSGARNMNSYPVSNFSQPPPSNYQYGNGGFSQQPRGYDHQW